MKPGRAPRLFANPFEIPSCSAGWRSLAKSQFRPPRHRADHIIEIVCDPAGESAYGFELLQLTYSLLYGVVLAAEFCIEEFSADRWQQACCVPFHHVIVRAQLHGFDRHFLANRS